jgi:hypothetical protein
MYCMMNERGRNAELLAYPPFWTYRFNHFKRDSHWLSVFDEYVERNLSVSQAAVEFERKYGTELDACRGSSDPDYVDWYDQLLALCRDDGFPITEEPQRRGYGHDGSMSEVRYSQADLQWTLHPRPPGFGSTSFPYLEMLWQIEERRLEAQEARRKANYAEWQRRVAEIDRRLKH